MKIAVTSMGNSLDSEVSMVFGRCAYFILADIENGEIKGFSPIKNSAMNERGVAGIKAAQLVANSNIDALISGAVGPNAFEILKKVGIILYKPESGSVKDNLKLFSENELVEITSSASAGMASRGRGLGGRGGR